MEGRRNAKQRLGPAKGQQTGEKVQEAKPSRLGEADRGSRWETGCLLPGLQDEGRGQSPAQASRINRSSWWERRASESQPCFLNILGSQVAFGNWGKLESHSLRKCTYVHIIPPSLLGIHRSLRAKSQTQDYDSQAQRMLLCTEEEDREQEILEGLLKPLNLWQTKWNSMRPGLKLVWIIYNLQQRLVRLLNWQCACESRGKAGAGRAGEKSQKQPWKKEE